MPGISLVLRCNSINNVEDTHLVHITTQMEFINITGPAATQNPGLHCSLLYDCIVLSCCILP